MIEKPCRTCDGSGKSYDITTADKVGQTDAQRAGVCSTCDGKGFKRCLTTEELVAEAKAHMASPQYRDRVAARRRRPNS